MEENQSLEGVVEYLIFENEDNGYVVFSVNTGRGRRCGGRSAHRRDGQIGRSF